MTCDVLVLGGGLAGSAAALAFARKGRDVVLVERDAATPAAFDDWERPGVAHFWQPHNFLGLGRQALEREAPDVVARSLELGAAENLQYELVPGGFEEADRDFVSLCTRRPLVELALHEAVGREPRIKVERAKATGLAAGRPLNAFPRVAGAKLDGSREVRAELVVDALGRTTHTLRWLEELGARPAAERRSECGLVYYSRHYRLRPGVDAPVMPSLLKGPRGDLGYLAFAVFVEDNGCFAVVFMIPTWERDLRVLRFANQQTAAAYAIPALVPWVNPDVAEPITDVLPMGSLQNLQRTLVVDGEPVAVGLQPIGDALCHTNPTFAYGASVALDHGFALAALADGDPRATALAFDDAVGRDDAARFESVSAEDQDRARMWKGEAVDFRDPGSSMALFLRMVAYAMAYEDADLFRAVARRLNGLERTDALERNSELVERARELADRAEPRGPQGPTRDELLAAVAAA